MAVRKSRGEWKIYGNVFDMFTNETLFKLASQGYFDQLKTAIALGKEANIFTATPGRTSEKPEHVIIKIYRLENSNFKKMYDYLRQDPRYMHTKPAKRAVIFAWCQREFRNLMLAREAITVPAPLGFKNNVLIIGLVGDAERGLVSAQLNRQPPKEPEQFARAILDNIAALWKKGLVHGDLSAFNILNDKEKPVFIDFSQSSPTSAANAKELLERDLTNVAAYFKRQDVKIDVQAELRRVQGS
jgi:RIO kinase 1